MRVVLRVKDEDMSKRWAKRRSLLLRRLVRVLRDVFLIALGALLVALALNWFLVPNRIAAGGVSGLATIAHHWMGWPVGLVSIILNVPLLVLALIILGRGDGHQDDSRGFVGQPFSLIFRRLYWFL